jgi:hypothetical protein
MGLFWDSQSGSGFKHLLYMVSWSTVTQMVATLSRFWCLVPCKTPNSVKTSFVLHVFAAVFLVWTWVLFAHTSISIVPQQKEPQPELKYATRYLVGLLTATFIVNLLVLTVYLACRSIQESTAEEQSYDTVPEGTERPPPTHSEDPRLTQTPAPQPRPWSTNWPPNQLSIQI